MAEALVKLTSVSVLTDGKKILRDVSWRIERDQRWVVIGPNGGGKSTLMRVASLAQHPTTGFVTVLGHTLGQVDIRQMKARVGVSSASLGDQLRSRLTAEEVVRCGRFAALEPWWHRYEPEDTIRALELLDRVGLDGQGDRRFGTLSSGERQRTLLARSLMNEPDVLILDQPTAGLDMAGREQLIVSLNDLAKSDGPVTVFVTHHVEDIPKTTTHLLAVAEGQAVASGPIGSTLTAALLSRAFGLDIELSQSGGRYSARAQFSSSTVRP